MPQFEIALVRERAEDALRRAGVRAVHARVVVDHLLTADLWDRTTHGLSVRLPGVLRLAREGVGRGEPVVRTDEGTRLVVDAGGSFGYVAALRCAELLVERTHEHALAAVALTNTSHTGLVGYYLERPAREGIVAMAFADCSPLMAPCGGARALLGTNPLTFAFPAQPDPILVDLATSAVSYGEVVRCRKAGEQLPEGCALDADGRPTRDPQAVIDGGALLPFGGHKGGALGLAVQLLAGVLTGASPVPPQGRDYGLLMVGIARGAFAGNEGYDWCVRELTDAYLAVPPQPGQEMHVPGWGRFERARLGAPAKLGISGEVASLLGLGS